MEFVSCRFTYHVGYYMHVAFVGFMFALICIYIHEGTSNQSSASCDASYILDEVNYNKRKGKRGGRGS